MVFDYGYDYGYGYVHGYIYGLEKRVLTCYSRGQ